jgi:hypothetical protein
MHSNSFWRAAIVFSVAATVAVALAGAAGASGLRSATVSALPESNIIDPLSRRGEEAAADRSNSELHGKSKKHNGVATPLVSATAFTSSSNAVAGQSFEGVSMWDQRTLNGFYLEPPDQGMCASTDARVGSGGRVLEAVNDVVAVYNTSGATIKEQTLNRFFGYPDLLAGGPELTDPSCYYDSETGAWFVVVLTLELGNGGNFTGENHVDIAVSNPSNHDPSTTTWKTYSIDTTDNGNNGSPNHNCAPDPNPNPDETMPDACIGDYPHIGADHYGFYVTTNEYPFFADGFNSAQIYALSKHKLAANETSVPWVQFANTQLAKEARGPVGFTIWPSVVPGTAYDEDNNGTEFLLSSDAAEESGNVTGSSDTIGLWAITNSKSLDSAHPDLNLSSRALSSEAYGVPPLSDQPGSGTQDASRNWPLGQCLNDTATAVLPGPPLTPTCFQLFLMSTAPGAPSADPYKPEVIGQLDSNDSRMQQVYYANGKVWGALDTRMSVNGSEQAGIAWFVVKPSMIASGNGGTVGPQSAVVNQGYIGVANANVTYPALAVTSAGEGAMAFTLVGAGTYPSAADTLFSNSGPIGTIHLTAPGLGLQDGFSEYKYYSPFAPGPNGEAPPPRPRWGDYGAADEDNGSIWIASEEIHNNCNLTTWELTAGHCGAQADRSPLPAGTVTFDGTPPSPMQPEARRLLGNWNTHIAHIAP